MSRRNPRNPNQGTDPERNTEVRYRTNTSRGITTPGVFVDADYERDYAASVHPHRTEYERGNLGNAPPWAAAQEQPAVNIVRAGNLVVGGRLDIDGAAEIPLSITTAEGTRRVLDERDARTIRTELSTSVENLRNVQYQQSEAINRLGEGMTRSDEKMNEIVAVVNESVLLRAKHEVRLLAVIIWEKAKERAKTLKERINEKLDNISRSLDNTAVIRAAIDYLAEEDDVEEES